MKNVQDFVKQLVKVDYVEQSDCYGHYPFSMFVETKDSKFEINALALGGDVAACYRRFKKYLQENAKRVYLALDFPSGGDIKNDFVCVFSFENEEFDVFAIPYKTEDGEILPQIKESEQLNKILADFKHIVM